MRTRRRKVDASFAASKSIEAVVQTLFEAIALTLIAVFVPLAFMTGLTGQFYKQFALTISISTVISASTR